MKRQTLPILLAGLLLAGCTNTGAFISGNQTIVNLNEGNYSVSATNITGESEAAFIFGFSYSTGLMANTFAIARVEGSGMMYAEALADLWDNYESENGALQNRRLALANIRYDTDILNLVFYSKVRLIVRADVIEFD